MLMSLYHEELKMTVINLYLHSCLRLTYCFFYQFVPSSFLPFSLPHFLPLLLSLYLHVHVPPISSIYMYLPTRYLYLSPFLFLFSFSFSLSPIVAINLIVQHIQDILAVKISTKVPPPQPVKRRERHSSESSILACPH